MFKTLISATANASRVVSHSTFFQRAKDTAANVAVIAAPVTVIAASTHYILNNPESTVSDEQLNKPMKV